MKCILIFTFFIPIGFIFSQISSVQFDNEISGTWVVYDTEVNAPELDSMAVVYTVDLVKSFQYKFKRNGKLFYEDVIIKNAEGTWNLTNDILTLKYSFEVPTFVSESGRGEHERTMKIIELTASHMIWYEVIDDKVTIKYFLRKQTNSNK